MLHGRNITPVAHVGRQEEGSLEENKDSSEAENRQKVIDRQLNLVSLEGVMSGECSFCKERVGLEKENDPFRQQIEDLSTGKESCLLVKLLLFLLQTHHRQRPHRQQHNYVQKLLLAAATHSSEQYRQN
jgi:hypothetical protein